MAIHNPVADQVITLHEQCRRPRREQYERLIGMAHRHLPDSYRSQLSRSREPLFRLSALPSQGCEQ